jgi:hypothetical protein
MAAWARVFLLTAVLGAGLVGYAAFRLVAGLPGLDFDRIDATSRWANGGLGLLLGAWVLGVAREAIAAKAGRSFGQVMVDAGFWTDGKKP